MITKKKLGGWAGINCVAEICAGVKSFSQFCVDKAQQNKFSVLKFSIYPSI